MKSTVVDFKVEDLEDNLPSLMTVQNIIFSQEFSYKLKRKKRVNIVKSTPLEEFWYRA